MTMFLMLTLSLGILMTSLSNPMAIMLTILVQSLNLSMMIWLYNKTAWFSYLLFLIFLGGLMVLFIYITSLASNNKFNSSWTDHINNANYITTATIILTIIMYFNFNPSSPSINTNNFITLNFSHSLITPISLIMIYLLITLIVVVKISTKMRGPLRLTAKK